MFIVNNGILERAASMSGSETNYKSGQGYIKIGNEPGDMQIANNEGVINAGRGSGIIVYNIKIYATALTYNEALHNYILDAVNKSDIINRNRSLDMITQKLTYNECCSYVPTFLISGDLRLILNKNADGSKTGKEESESNVDITYVNPYDPTRNFTVEGCQIRKHGQSTLTYFPNSLRSLRSIFNLPICSSCGPCEKLKRATFIPSSINALITASLSVDGPNVQIIFVLLVINSSFLFMVSFFKCSC